MKVEHFGGAVEVADSAALDAVLDARYGDDVNEYWLGGDAKYPCLAIQVRGSVACLHFFPREEHPGFLSVGESASAGDETFYTNTPTEEIYITASAVVPFEQARKAAHEYLRTGLIPSSVRWLEL